MRRRRMRVIHARTNQVMLSNLCEATGPWQQFAGLMFRASLDDGAGLIFRPARGIHTHFMRFPIDLIYLDQWDRVRAIHPDMAPWRFDMHRSAAVIETKSGTASQADLQIGDQLHLEPW